LLNLYEHGNHWGESSWFLHLHSKDAPYETNQEGRIILAENFKQNATTPPEIFSCNCLSSKIDLPAPSRISESTLVDALTLRRSCRNYNGKPITLQELSDLLFYTAGVLFTNDTVYYGTVAKKTAPSPGGRHTTELYPVINECIGLPRGFYHYCQQHHVLNLLQEGEVRPFLKEALYGQDYFLDASVTVFYTSIVDRLMWKYKSSRVYRLMHFETAHYAQNFLLTGTALSLGVFVTGAVKESLVEPTLRIDGIHEVAMYVTGAGHQGPGGPYDRESHKLSEYVPKNLLVTLPDISKP
jgi:SagB-type dehydrogenase family enzyme